MMNQLIESMLAMFYIVPIAEDYTSIKQVPDYILNSIPFFFGMVLIEWMVSMMCRRTVYSFKDAIMSFSLGAVQQLCVIWLKALKVVPYITIYILCAPLRSKLVQLLPSIVTTSLSSSSTATFFAGMLGCDICYYLFHRLAHEYHIVWLGHSVHHSGERYNLATALRQGVVQSLFTWIVYLPLAVLGLDPITYIRHDRLNTVYQFWIHTEFIGRLPLLFEMVFNTPSHHRLHHHPPGNCNYAGVLIIWDRLFNTFVPEYPSASARKFYPMAKESIFGLAKPLDSFDPVFANISHLNKVYESQSSIQPHNQSQIIWKMLGFAFKKRVDTAWTINLSFQKLFPDIDGNTTLLDLISFQHLLRLPNYADESLSDMKEELQNAELALLQQRSVREGKVLSGQSMMKATMHFVLTILASLVILLKSKHIYEFSPIGLILSSSACVLSFQSIQAHYK
jgi:sterol desaturase/sphingolipid hydroxylase (fatty acid hydroxylase superfamily)